VISHFLCLLGTNSAKHIEPDYYITKQRNAPVKRLHSDLCPSTYEFNDKSATATFRFRIGHMMSLSASVGFTCSVSNLSCRFSRHCHTASTDSRHSDIIGSVRTQERLSRKSANHSPRPSRQPDSDSPSLDCGGMPRAIGRERTNPLSGTKDRRVRGCTPTCIAGKAIRATQPAGTVGRTSPFAGSHWMRNGSAS
jgi:hypothetical protein